MQAATLPCLRIELGPCDAARRIVRNPVEEQMKCSKIFVITVPLLLCFALSGVAQLQKGTQAGDGPLLRELVGLERSALDRWIKVDPEGYLSLYDPGISYFDPFTEKRIDGLEGLQARVAQMKGTKSPFEDLHYEIVDPRVQRFGDVGVLTFQVINYGKVHGQPESVVSHWNSTEIYARVHGKWKIVHSHWSFVKPQLKQP